MSQTNEPERSEVLEHPRYILTIHNRDVLKEVDISETTQRVKIGTLPDCDVRFKRELFNTHISVSLTYGMRGWRIATVEGLYFNSPVTRGSVEADIEHGDEFTLHAAGESAPLLTFYFAYDFAVKGGYDTMVDISGVGALAIGNTPGAQIRLEGKFIKHEYLTLTRDSSGGYTLDATYAPKIAILNGLRVKGESKIQEYDFIGIADHSFYYRRVEDRRMLYFRQCDGLTVSGLDAIPVHNYETDAFEYPKFNRSPRLRYAFNTESIEILNPPKKPEKPKESWAQAFLPAMLMIAIVVVIRGGMLDAIMGGEGGGGGMQTMVIMSVAMMSVGVVMGFVRIWEGRRTYRRELAEWRGDYEGYILEKREEIESEQRKEATQLMDVYPTKDELRDLVMAFSGRLFERSHLDDDFLHARVGVGEIPAMRKPSFKNEDKIKVDNDLVPIPEKICRDYAALRGAPVVLAIREIGNLGVVGTPAMQYEFFKNLLLDVAFEHFYEELKVVVLLPKGEQKRYEWLKWLPHLKDSGGDARGIVCDDESREHLFEHLFALMANREILAGVSGRPAPAPHFVVFALDEYGMKTHPLYNFTVNCTAVGFSFVYFQEYAENLPTHCSEIIYADEGGGARRLKNDKAFMQRFAAEPVTDMDISVVANRLAPVFTEKIALSSRLTASITLFELLNILSPEDLDLGRRWRESNAVKSLAAPLGVDVKGQLVSLDLHDNPKAHGPHGLVAGTTGAGKSEILQSYILSCAVNFHPYEVSFVIIDFKGGGMANQFEDLPHLIGKITDIDDREINRSLLSIRAELEKRKRLFAEQEVNHIDAYIQEYRNGRTGTPLPHLILVVDEFAELKAEQPEFMKELISAARVGRSLGIHLILATQKPSGQVSEQIWSNSKFKLCLKVANKEDSNEVLKSPLAAEIREPGRAYLQVGNNEIFSLFQSAYSGASAKSDKIGIIREFSISEVSFTGRRAKVYERRAELSQDGKKTTQLDAIVEHAKLHCEKAGIAMLPSICPPPLPDVMQYEAAQPGPRPVVRVGMFDDPTNQRQPNVEINLSEGNVAIFGASQTGKTMLLQSVLRSVAANCQPRQVSVYILDYASKVLKVFEGMCHVGGVVTEGEDEKIKNFFKMMGEEARRRKELFAQMGISSYEAYTENPKNEPMPRVLVMVDNLTAFKETHADGYENDLVHLCREGLALGVTVIATAKQTTGLSYKYLSNFGTRLAFSCTESSEYGSIFDRCSMQPRDLPGRGLVSIDKIVYEFQSYLAFEGDTESSRAETIKAFIQKTNKRCGKDRARPIPSIPKLLTREYFDGFKFDDYVVPVGLDYAEIEPVTVNLMRVGAFGIYGREGFGKSNLLRVLMKYLHKKDFESPGVRSFARVFLLDGYDRQMSEFQSHGFVEEYTVDCARFGDFMDLFADEAENRRGILMDGGSLAGEPLLMLVARNTQLYTAQTVSRPALDQYKKLLQDARQLKICFLFSDVENSGDFSAPDIQKSVKDFPQVFLLDDLAEVKVFGANKYTHQELREHRKPLLPGEGFVQDGRKGLMKIKLVKEG